MSVDRYFEVLELGPGASREEVKRAYREQCKVWHPDRFREDPQLQAKAQERLKRINEAYAKLRDVTDRTSPRPGPPHPTQPPPASHTRGHWEPSDENAQAGVDLKRWIAPAAFSVAVVMLLLAFSREQRDSGLVRSRRTAPESTRNSYQPADSRSTVGTAPGAGGQVPTETETNTIEDPPSKHEDRSATSSDSDDAAPTVPKTNRSAGKPKAHSRTSSVIPESDASVIVEFSDGSRLRVRDLTQQGAVTILHLPGGDAVSVPTSRIVNWTGNPGRPQSPQEPDRGPASSFTVRFEDGRVLEVAGVEVQGETVLLSLEGGGAISIPSWRVVEWYENSDQPRQLDRNDP